ncbi:MAG: MFS transporter [Candidatus Woesearchaeota archaeon]
MDKVRQDIKKRELISLGLASFFNDLGSDMIYPIWPLFITSVMNANMFILGLIDGIGDAIVAISKALSGYLSDKTGKRKVFIWLGYLMAFFSRLGYAISKTWIHLIPFKILDRFGKIRGSPRDAIVSEISKEKGKNFGIIRSMDNLGAFFGVILCLILINFVDIKTIFYIAAFPSLISVLLVLLFIKEGKRGKIKKISLNLFDKNFKIFLISSFFITLGSFSYSFFLIFVKEYGLSEKILPLFYLLFTFMAAIASYPSGRLFDKYKKKVIYFAIFLYVVMLFLFTKIYLLENSLIILIMLFLVYGISKGIFETSMSTLSAQLSPKKLKATGIGSFQLITGLSALPSSTIAGFLWLKFGYIITFYFAIVSMIIGFAILIFVKEK